VPRVHLSSPCWAALRAAVAGLGEADFAQPVAARGQVLTAGDFLGAHILEWTLRHLDLAAHLPAVPGPPAAGSARSRVMLEQIAGVTFPASWSDTDALLVGTGRRAATGKERAALGPSADRLPFALGRPTAVVAIPGPCGQ
jgi:hypothetical protein